MKAIGDVLRDPGRLINRPEQFQPDGGIKCFPHANGTQLCLTPEELGAAGYREFTGPRGKRVVQFWLCREAHTGEWLYPPLRREGETTDQMLERNAEARRLMKRCESAKKPVALRGFDE